MYLCAFPIVQGAGAGRGGCLTIARSTLQVTWKPSRVTYAKRYEKYLDPSFFQHRIHWFSIFNSFMMVLFLVGLVSMILMRTLRKDYARYSREDELDDMVRVCYRPSRCHRPSAHAPVLCDSQRTSRLPGGFARTQKLTTCCYVSRQERDLGDEYGWKQVHGDVFRSPPHILLFSSLVGTGHQLAVVSLVVIVFAIVGDLYVG